MHAQHARQISRALFNGHHKKDRKRLGKTDDLSVSLFHPGHILRSVLRARDSFIVESVTVRHHIRVLSRGRKRRAFQNRDRVMWPLSRRVWQDRRKPLAVVQPVTVI